MSERQPLLITSDEQFNTDADNKKKGLSFSKYDNSKKPIN